MNTRDACTAQAALPELSDATARFREDLEGALEVITADRPKAGLLFVIRSCPNHTGRGATR